MKRCQSKGTKLIVLILTSLFIFTSCGIPTYFYLDESEFITSVQSDTVENQVNLEIKLSDSALVKISDKDVVDGPGLKFFYALSNNSSTYIIDGITQINTVSSSFNTNFKGIAGNGLIWSPDYASAPGFYLYTNESGKKNTFSLDRPDSITNGLVIGTFAISGTGLNDYEYRKAPEMDISLEDELLPINIMIQKGDDDPIGYANLKIDINSGEDLLDLQSYTSEFKKFPTNTDSLAELVSTDSDFLSYLGTPQDLFLHVWVSLYCGKGGFTNKFWSNLRYAGYIELF